MRNNWVVRFAQDQDIVKKEMWTKNCNTRATPEQLAELMRCLEQNEPFPKSAIHLVTPDRLFRLKKKTAPKMTKEEKVKMPLGREGGDAAPGHLPLSSTSHRTMPKGSRVKSQRRKKRKGSRPQKLDRVGSRSNDGHLYQGFQSSETAIIFSKVGLKEQLLDFCTRGALGRAHTVHVSLLLYDC